MRSLFMMLKDLEKLTNRLLRKLKSCTFPAKCAVFSLPMCFPTVKKRSFWVLKLPLFSLV